MEHIMKKLLFTILLGHFILQAAPDPEKSYFTVSTHQPGLGKNVTVNIFLRDSNGKGCDASKLLLKPEGEIKRLGAGNYRVEMVFRHAGEKVTPKIIADGVPVLENLLPDGGSIAKFVPWTNDVRKAALEHDGEWLRIIALSSPIGASWSAGSLSGKSLLHDRKYRFSMWTETCDIGSGGGTALNFGQRNAAGKWAVSGHYTEFLRNGSAKKRLCREFRPVPAATWCSFSAVVNNTTGQARFRAPRLEVIPTFIVQDTEGVRAEVVQGKGGERKSRNYRNMLVSTEQKGIELVERMKARFGEERLASVFHGFPRPKAVMTAEEVFAMQRKIRQTIHRLEQSELEFEKVRLISGAVSITAPRMLADGMRALEAPAGRPVHFYTNFSLLKPAGRDAIRRPAIACGYDRQNFYVTVKVPGKVTAVKGSGAHDDPALWRGSDVIELFINKPGSRGYSQFAVGPGGQKYDEAEGDAFVNFLWDSKIHVDTDGWTAEFSIPWTSLEMDPAKNREIRMNCSVTSLAAPREVYSWSLANTGFREYESMGFVVLDSFPEGTGDYIAYKNRQIEAEHKATVAQSQRDATALRSVDGRDLVCFNWDNDTVFKKDPAFQMRCLVRHLNAGSGVSLNFRQAVNEFAHRSFALAAVKAVDGLVFTPGDLKSADGSVIPADRLSLNRIGFLEPNEKLWPNFFQKWSGIPIPELVEKVDGPISIPQFTMTVFRLYIDSRDVVPGIYSGEIALGKVRIPVRCEVMNITLPPCETQPVSTWIFTMLPYGGESGEAWARFLREHYVTDVSFEHPPVSVNGRRVKDFRKGWPHYIREALSWKTPDGATVTIDGSIYDFDDRVKLCAKYNLRMIFCNRDGYIYPDHIPYLLRYLNKLGVKDGNFIYKLGDEDNSPHFLPVAKHIRRLAPGIQVTMIPSGTAYWDLTQLMDGFTFIDYSRAAMTIDRKGEEDLKKMRESGFPIRRYTNRTSWAERSGFLAGRLDLWEVMIREGLGGYVIWTAGVDPRANYGLGYRSIRNFDWKNLPPENQHLCQLVYYRRQGDFYKPVSCIRLEDMRDGITDVLYYRLAKETLHRKNDRLGLEQLNEIVRRPKMKFSDYEKARTLIAHLILK